MYDFSIIGGGIIGLSTAFSLTKKYPTAKIVLIEKENIYAKHQTGRNSGVIHSGVYYKPGSLKAKLAKQGNISLTKFCKEYGINHDICGKVIVATNFSELTELEKIYKRGIINGIDVIKLNKEELEEIEPYVNGLAAVMVPSAGIVDYKKVSETFAYLITKKGVDFYSDTKLKNVNVENNVNYLETNKGIFKAKYLINCAGLFSDRIAEMANFKTNIKIVPFRGEYYKLIPEMSFLINNLVYPVPNPDFPFLGVHFTRMLDGSIHAGPNAVLALKREGYNKLNINFRDLIDTVSYSGFLKLARKHYKEGAKEIYSSLNKMAFLNSLKKLVPDIEWYDIEKCDSGVRAQAIKKDGSLVDDFVILRNKNAIHVCNTPSPAATSSIEIGNYIVELIAKQITKKSLL